MLIRMYNGAAYLCSFPFAAIDGRLALYGWTGGSACALLLYELLRDVGAGPLMCRAALSVNRIPINRDIGRMRHFTHVRAQAGHVCVSIENAPR